MAWPTIGFFVLRPQLELPIVVHKKEAIIVIRRIDTVGSRSAVPARTMLVRGKEVFEFTKLHIGAKNMDRVLEEGGEFRMPYNFWNTFFAIV